MAFKRTLAGMSRWQLRAWIAAFALALGIPTGALCVNAYEQLKWQAFHQQRQLAEEFVQRVDARARAWIDQQEAHTFADYSFLAVTGDPTARYVQRSRLSAFPVNAAVPGLLGYFQLDADGRFSTPLLPATEVASNEFGLAAGEVRQRLALQNRLQQILVDNQMMETRAAVPLATAGAPADVPLEYDVEDADSSSVKLEAAVSPPLAQAYFDRLSDDRVDPARNRASGRSIGQVSDLALDSTLEEQVSAKAAGARPALKKLKPAPARAVRKERAALAELNDVPQLSAGTASDVRIRTFESEVGPFELSFLTSGHLVLHRRVWRDGKRYVQGALLDVDALARALVEVPFAETVLAANAKLALAYQGAVIKVFSGQPTSRLVSSAAEFSGALLHKAKLSAPLSDFELIFSLRRLPAGPGGTLVTWLAVIISAVLVVSSLLFYRLIAKQIDLAQQQQDFVAAVSHELKTPLTSIRMYGEMLRAGWVSEERRTSYYDFIFTESERLTRLIQNVLQLARMTRNELDVTLEAVTMRELTDLVAERASAQLESTEFELDFAGPDADAELQTRVDRDFVSQILINLLDNAVKFSARSATQRIEVRVYLEGGDVPCISVRDFGPGIARSQMKRIFELFYRSENEMTRETAGTGIGLALVHQLARAMGARVDVANVAGGSGGDAQTGGARFTLRLQLAARCRNPSV
ncbi:MAG: HAMP domain-containing sensor histidine kinase [Pseudomonadota bacterium]